MFSNIYQGRKVLVTGHTGFKGSWLSAWLLELGAEVAGYSIDLPSEPCNFEALKLKNRMLHVEGDVRDPRSLQQTLDDFKPEIVFHLAAQALVRKSYEDPVLTFETNALGSLYMLQAIRECASISAGVFITSDKCYHNSEWLWGYRETDPLGGADPYSASKACAEIIASAYMKSFFTSEDLFVATARAGNVIGGGDWAADRIIPDCARAWSRGESLPIRNPKATRPWQHVLEPLGGYLHLGAHLFNESESARNQAFNFGPHSGVIQPVEELIEEFCRYWKEPKWDVVPPDPNQKESNLLKLNCDKALTLLGWEATLDFESSIRFTGEWYQAYYEQGPEAAAELSLKQIEEYVARARRANLSWTQ
ncbi:MAG: CDP-glucose 4,6-dehydratase [Candidatus Nitrohelix vancouverensis]|uniref:CDP-glucose 4,6-dehydratase n=1 Tax=Candidatus Nitrohelix vancouverensis TaxID=2705534 RepID=A0A7T0C042_9BACT|nr:MAG: CDP-glucose 4,6-dehydratase [Candidatus Nitrohelix vancouverensis]